MRILFTGPLDARGPRRFAIGPNDSSRRRSEFWREVRAVSARAYINDLLTAVVDAAVLSHRPSPLAQPHFFSILQPYTRHTFAVHSSTSFAMPQLRDRALQRARQLARDTDPGDTDGEAMTGAE